MEREAYRKTEIYQKSLTLVKEFINEVLDGELDNLREFCFEDLYDKKIYGIKYDKYRGKILDPDMLNISQAIYFVIWGWYFELDSDNLGSWGRSNNSRYPYRGDTMNSFNSLFGGTGNGNKLGFRAKFFELDKKQEVWDDVLQYYKKYHTIGNFIVIPNRENVNSKRGNYVCGMRDYFDWFLISIYNHQQICKGNIDLIIKEYDDIICRFSQNFRKTLACNNEYRDMDMLELKQVFYLDNYFNGCVPQPFINVSPKERRKITMDKKYRPLNNEKYFTNEEYEKIVIEYIKKSIEVINFRTDKIIEQLKIELNMDIS